ASPTLGIRAGSLVLAASRAGRTRMAVDARALLRIAEQAVTIASRLVRRKRLGAVITKGDRDVVTDIDYAVEHAVREFLARETPEFGFLGEEEGLSRADGGPMWVLDPVDGTANF